MRIYVLAAAATVLSGCSFFDSQGDFMSPYAPSATIGGTYTGCAAPAPTGYYGAGTGCASSPQHSGQYQYASVQPTTSVQQLRGSHAVQSYGGCQSYAPEQHYVAPSPCGQATYAQTQNYQQPEPASSYQYSDCPVSCGGGYTAANTSHDYYNAGYASPETSHYYAAGPGGYSYPVTYDAAYNTGLRAKTDYFYGEVGANAQYNIDDVSPLFGGIARVGYQSPNYLGFEVEGSKGLTSDEQENYFGTIPADFENADYKSKYSVGAFAVARVPLGPVKGLLRAGYHQSVFDVDSTTTALTEEIKGDGVAFGAGLEIPLNAKSSLRADTTAYDMNGDRYVVGSSITYQHKF